MTDPLQDILDILQACNIDYMVVGSVSSSLHGQARATQDLDVVVSLSQEQLDVLLARPATAFPRRQPATRCAGAPSSISSTCAAVAKSTCCP